MPDICVWNKCNNKCLMCTNSRDFSGLSPDGNYDLKSQVLKWRMYASGKGDIYISRKRNYINLTGGEPTLHPEFLQLIWFFRKQAPQTPITLLSNGRRFKDPFFARKFSRVALPPFSVGIAIHGPSAGKFDKITGVKGSFSETVRGLKNLFRYFTGEIEFRIVVHGLNAKDLGKITGFLRKNFGSFENWHVTFIHYEIEGVAEENRKKIFVKPTESARFLDENYDLLEGLHFELYHWPLCAVPERLRSRCRITLPREDRVYTKKCAGCALRARCLGLMKDYYRLYGDSELKAHKTKLLPGERSK